MKKLFSVMKILAVVLLVLTLAINRLMPIEYTIAIGLVEIILLFVFHRRKFMQVLVVIIMIITSSGLMYIEYSASRLINYDPNIENTISFFVLKESKITSIKKVVSEDARIGASSILNQEVLNFIEDQLRTKDYVKPLVEVEGIEQCLDSFFAGDFDVLAVDQAYLNTTTEFDALFLEKTKVIWSVVKSNEMINLEAANVAKEPFIIYIAGTDDRVEANGEVFRSGRNDVNMIAVVNPKSREITLVSVPRDSYVQLGCFSKKAMDKLTHAGVYGLECSIKTMQDLFEVEFNYYAQVGFETVTKLVGALGTINVWLESDVTVGTTVYKAGWNALDKFSALDVARARHGLINGDQTRINNQQEVLKGIFNKLIELSTLTKTESIIRSIEGTVKTNMTGDDIFSLVRMQIRDMRGWTFTQVSVEGNEATLPSFAMGGRMLFMVELNKDSLSNARKAIQDALKEEAQNEE